MAMIVFCLCDSWKTLLGELGYTLLTAAKPILEEDTEYLMSLSDAEQTTRLGDHRCTSVL